MLHHVNHHGFLAAEGRMTINAHVRLLTCVCHLMLLEVVFGATAVAADVTLECLLILVYQHMLVQVR